MLTKSDSIPTPKQSEIDQPKAVQTDELSQSDLKLSEEMMSKLIFLPISQCGVGVISNHSTAPPSHNQRMQDPKYAYPYPAQGYYHGPPVMAPPQSAAPPPRSCGFLEGWNVNAEDALEQKEK
ncbi:hypothetical protein MUK42_13826 [Musa troglodytarum]|uniref:Uncharacterized protein n=1 Tax=Musa troglodytarum TaxID=320322 RepID=A0A9E7HLS9_9LILI|nr:hypothetical protein MUK42_13826 [Musa troglodytarum]